MADISWWRTCQNCRRPSSPRSCPKAKTSSTNPLTSGSPSGSSGSTNSAPSHLQPSTLNNTNIWDKISSDSASSSKMPLWKEGKRYWRKSTAAPSIVSVNDKRLSRDGQTDLWMESWLPTVLEIHFMHRAWLMMNRVSLTYLWSFVVMTTLMLLWLGDVCL